MTELSLIVLLGVYVPLVFAIGFWISKRKFLQGGAKIAVMTVFIAAAFLVPFGDVMLNSWAMMRVCDDAGLNVYKHMAVDGYYDPKGSALVLEDHPYRFIEFPGPNGKTMRLQREDGVHIEEMLMDAPTAQYEFVYRENFFNTKLGVYENRVQARLRNSRLLPVGEWVEYKAVPGWIDREVVMPRYGGSAGSCGFNSKAHTFRAELLKPARYFREL